ncbi:MAG: hypothetical protein NWE95_09575 [Candidatus Bathyarchaeota archaeon]|nr:hypothetical protein [Candidatus Bathyarchaeota archaeon]
MSSPSRIQITHYPERKCKFSESMDLTINNKTIVTPTFAPRIKGDGELKVYSTVKSLYSPRHLSVQVVRLLDAGRTVYRAMKHRVPLNIVDQTLVTPPPQSGENVLIIDPALEYLYYTANMERIANTPFVPRAVNTYVKSYMAKEKRLVKAKAEGEEVTSTQLLREAEHSNFWSCVGKDTNMRTKLMRDTFTLELKCRADILVPPVPLITNAHLLNMAILMNEKSRAFAPALDDEKRDCADYFIVKPNILRNEHMMATIKEYVADSEAAITLFKFKNLNLCEESLALDRAAFKSFLMELALVTQHSEKKAFGLLEAGNQTFPAALSSFAIVSTGFNLDREDRRKDQQDISPFVNRYDPANMVMQNKDTFLRTVSNNHGIPCDCKVCLENPEVPIHDFIEYNRLAKEHYLLCREQEMKEIVNAIERQESQMGFEKLQRSSLKNLIDIIPR